MDGSSAAHGGRFRARAAELAAWVVLFVAARALLALAYCDVFAYLEEFEKAAAGKALLDGLGLAHQQLAYHPYEGGGFVVSHLDALAFLAFGESVLAVKLVALALGSVLLAVGWGLCRRASGLAAARVFALLFVFAPASMQQNSLLALGIHFHALIFVAALLWGVLAVLEGGAERRATCFATGCAAGFGLFFSYQLALVALVALGALAGLGRARGRSVALRALAWASIGALAGAAPLIWMATHAGAAVFDIHGAELVQTRLPRSELLGQFAASFFAGRDGLDRLGLALGLAAPLSAWFAWRSGASAARLSALLACYGALFAVAYFGLGFTIGRVTSYFLLQRLAPLWFVGLTATALGAAALWNAGGARRWLGAALAGACALCGAADLWRLTSAAAPYDWCEHARVLATTKGYAYPQYMQKLAPRLRLERQELARTFLRFDEEDRELLLEALSAAVWGRGDVELDALEQEARAAGVGDSRGLLAAQGMSLRNRWGGDIAARLAQVRTREAARAEVLEEAIGRFGNRYFPSVDAVRRELEQGLAAQAPPSFFFGLGMRAFAARGDLASPGYPRPTSGPWCFDERRARAFIDAQSEPVRSALAEGYEHARALARLDGRDASRATR